VFDQGLALCRASGERAWSRVIVAGLGYGLCAPGAPRGGHALLEEAISESIRTGALENHSPLGLLAQRGLSSGGTRRGGLQHACQALDLAQQQKERGDEALTLHQLGVVYAHAAPPDTEQAETHYQQALALAEALGMRPLQAHCHHALGMLYARRARWEQARAETGRRHRDVPLDGDDILAPPGGGRHWRR